MKRGAVWLVSAVLGAGLVLFSACGFVGGPVNNDGTISGNYRPATDIEILQVFHSIQQDKVFGDVSAQAWNFGLEYATDRLVSLRCGETNWKDHSDVFYRLVLDREDEMGDIQTRGVGYGSSELTVPAGVYTDSSVQLLEDYSLCNDAQYLYRVGTERWRGLDVQADGPKATKVSLDGYVWADTANDLFGMPLRLMEDIIEVAKGGEADSIFLTEMTWEDVLLLRERLEDYGLDLEVDLSSGVKLRLSASEETVRLILAEKVADRVGAVDADIEELAAALPVRFVQCAYDIYFAVDADGVFSGIGVRADIEAVIEGLDYDLATGSPLEESESDPLRLTIRGMERLAVYNGDVTLPNDLDRYEEPGLEEDDLPEGDNEEDISEEDTSENADTSLEDLESAGDTVVLPTVDEFRESIVGAFQKLCEELYAAVQEIAEPDMIPDIVI